MWYRTPHRATGIVNGQIINYNVSLKRTRVKISKIPEKEGYGGGVGGVGGVYRHDNHPRSNTQNNSSLPLSKPPLLIPHRIRGVILHNRWIIIRDIGPKYNQDQRNTNIPTSLNCEDHTPANEPVFLEEEVVLQLGVQGDGDGNEHCPKRHVHKVEEFAPGDS